MTLRLKALRSLRWNYRWRGVWAWLWGAPRRRCEVCKGAGVLHVDFGYGPPFTTVECTCCMGDGTIPGLKLGWERIWDEPEQVLAEQTQLAEGVFA